MTSIKKPGALSETNNSARDEKMVSLFRDHGVTIAAMASRFGVSKNYISAVLRGRGLDTTRFMGLRG